MEKCFTRNRKYKSKQDMYKTLGISIGQNKEMCYNKNWTKIVDDFEKLFESWKTRKLTIFGKVCVINSLAIPKFLYTGSILNLPDEGILKKIQSLLYNFI